MKKFNLIWLTGVILGLTIFSSCDNNDDNGDNDVNNLSRNYFSIDDAKFINAPVPDGSLNAISDLSINQTVITGGSSIISLSSSEALSSVYVGVEGETGYYEYNLTGIRSTAAVYNYQIVLLISQNITRSFVIRISAVTVSGAVTSLISSDQVSIMEVGTGKLQVSLSWDQKDDVDLHLFEPDGTEIYYSNSTSYFESNVAGLLDLDSNAACNIIDGINNENITYETYVKEGTYKVAVDLYQKCDLSNVGAKYSVTAIYNGRHITLDKPTGQFDDNDKGSFDDESKYHIIGTFTIGAGGLRSSEVKTKDPSIREKGPRSKK